MLSIYTVPNLDSPKIRHGFYGRTGGASTGIYQSLNCGLCSSDKTENVLENLNRVKVSLGANKILTLSQCHSNNAIIVKDGSEDRRKADAMVTDKAGIALGALSADCGPILFTGQKDSGRPVVAATHAGWKGAFGGILESTIQQMLSLGAAQESIKAAIGPCIAQKSYEVDIGFETDFLEEDEASEMFFKSGKTGKLHFDLPGYIAFRLGRSGLSSIHISGIDTYVEKENYFSYRRSCHKGENGYGRQISTIVISTDSND
ncbi:MAG: polyphenol oxidase [Micavibrio sp.]|nr:polyphenol oxidase [Micavibrio sp.]